MVKALIRLIMVGFTLFALTACGGVDSSISSLTEGSIIDLPNIRLRADPDFIPGEIVTTSSGTPGYQVKAVFGEISEKQTTSNGWQIEGVFYE
jgi:hypothetical protein